MMKIFGGRKLLQRQKQIACARSHFPELDAAILDTFFDNFGHAMALSLLVKIGLICKTVKPRMVVEFGSGLSTVVITKALSDHESFLITFDESMRWLANTRGLIAHSPTDIAFVCIAHDGGMNHGAISRYMSFRRKPELLVIDGPSRGERFSPSALAVYSDLLSSDCFCVVDDTDREENNRGANRLALDFSLHKYDYSDPIYTNHRYCILVPDNWDVGIFSWEDGGTTRKE